MTRGAELLPVIADRCRPAGLTQKKSLPAPNHVSSAFARCSIGQQLRGGVEQHLAAWALTAVSLNEAHL
jgi:hypothetical protein